MNIAIIRYNHVLDSSVCAKPQHYHVLMMLKTTCWENDRKPQIIIFMEQSPSICHLPPTVQWCSTTNVLKLLFGSHVLSK